ncbi:hypothetical protein Bbelb_353580 [Branchiostoma belcheri]|nr:hypothetical protein Bbelb_353580 [Branchiostoma belcheri]
MSNSCGPPRGSTCQGPRRPPILTRGENTPGPLRQGTGEEEDVSRLVRDGVLPTVNSTNDEGRPCTHEDVGMAGGVETGPVWWLTSRQQCTPSSRHHGNLRGQVTSICGRFTYRGLKKEGTRRRHATDISESDSSWAIPKTARPPGHRFDALGELTEKIPQFPTAVRSQLHGSGNEDVQHVHSPPQAAVPTSRAPRRDRHGLSGRGDLNSARKLHLQADVRLRLVIGRERGDIPHGEPRVPAVNVYEPGISNALIRYHQSSSDANTAAREQILASYDFSRKQTSREEVLPPPTRRLGAGDVNKDARAVSGINFHRLIHYRYFREGKMARLFNGDDNVLAWVGASEVSVTAPLRRDTRRTWDNTGGKSYRTPTLQTCLRRRRERELKAQKTMTSGNRIQKSVTTSTTEHAEEPSVKIMPPGSEGYTPCDPHSLGPDGRSPVCQWLPSQVTRKNNKPTQLGFKTHVSQERVNSGGPLPHQCVSSILIDARKTPTEMPVAEAIPPVSTAWPNMAASNALQVHILPV